jgi:hypothetical protein
VGEGCGRCVRQYPGEREITFPPYTCLESDGDPRVEYTDQGEVVIFPLKVRPPNRRAYRWCIVLYGITCMLRIRLRVQLCVLARVLHVYLCAGGVWGRRR